MKHRIIGFDLARSYAIFGMFIVNFNFSFGSVMMPSNFMGRFLNLFTGNSTAIFIICAGMGLSFMSNGNERNVLYQKQLRSKVLKRSWFLFGLGLLLLTWWSGDILHFYGGYMHLGAFLLFISKRWFLIGAVTAILIFHLLLFIIPIETGWNFKLFKYEDLWTVPGFLRNTFYNGWNSIFPWFAYFLLGMWLGRLDWKNSKIRWIIFGVGTVLFFAIVILRFMAKHHFFDEYWTTYIQAEYFPAYLPFQLITIGFALMLIPFCVYLGERFSSSPIVHLFQKTGQMALSLYILHLTVGMLVFTFLTNKHYSGYLEDEVPTSPGFILAFTSGFYLLCMAFCFLWSKKFKFGPIETLMRRISG